MGQGRPAAIRRKDACDGKDTKQNKARIEPTITEIKNRLGITDEEARQKFNTTRARVQQAIDLVKLHNKSIGEGLGRLLKAGTLKVDFVSQHAKAACHGDGKSGITVYDKINIGSNVALEADGVIHSVSTLHLVKSLLHEGVHADDYYMPMPETDPDRIEIRKRQEEARQEIKAENAEIALTDDLLKGLANLEDPKNPAPTSDFTKTVINSIKTLPGPPTDPESEQGKAIKALRDAAETNKKESQTLIDLYNKANVEYQKFIDHDIDKSQLNDNLNGIDQKGYKLGPLEPLASTSITPGDPGKIDQLLAGVNQQLDTSFATVMDLEVPPSGTLLLASGFTAGGLGGVVGFADQNSNGLLEQGELFTAVPPTAQLSSNLDLFSHPLTGQFFVYDAASGAIFTLHDGSGDGLPDELGINIASAVTIPTDFLQFEWTSGDTLFGFPNFLDAVPSVQLMPDLSPEVLKLDDANSDGLLDSAQEVLSSDLVGFEPVIVSTTVPSVTWLIVHATADSYIQILSVDADNNILEILSEETAPSTEPFTMELSRPLELGELLVPRDTTLALDGPDQLVNTGAGGVAELPDVASDSSSSTRTYAALAGGLAAVVVALSAGAWYARRRWAK